MKTLYTPLALLALSFSVGAVELPERTVAGDFENINERKEYEYEVYPNLVFWNEAGRPFWRDLTAPKTTFQENKKIHFDMEEAKLDSNDKERLRTLAQKLNKNEDRVDHVIINGFASKPGQEKYNKDLSIERAVNVKNYLISKGVDSSMIITKAYGEKMPMSTREKSRRVEIYIR